MARSKKRWLLYGGILLVVLFLLMMVMRGGKQETRVAIDEVSLRTIVETVSASGKIYPKNEVKISPQVPGEIVALRVQEGDSVSQGDTIMRLNPNVYRSSVERAMAAVNQMKANLASARANLAQTEAQYEQSMQSFYRNQDLYDKKVISKAEWESSRANFRSAQATMDGASQAVNAASFNIQSAQATLNEARDNLQWTIIVAPVSGVVSLLNVEKGETVVGTAQMAGTELCRIADLGNMEAHVDVSENDIVRVKLGDEAIIEVDAYVDEKFSGTVVQIANSSGAGGLAGVADQATNFKVKVKISGEAYERLMKLQGHAPFRPGMNTTVRIKTDTRKDVIAVAIQSVTTREKEDDKGGSVLKEVDELVFVVEGGKAIGRKVKTGIQDDEFIEIKEGLKEGEEVIIAPFKAISKTLSDEMKVEVVPEDVLYN